MQFPLTWWKVYSPLWTLPLACTVHIDITACFMTHLPNLNHSVLYLLVFWFIETLNVFSLFIKILLYCHQPVAVADDRTLVNCVKCLVTSWLQCLLHFYFSLIGEGGLSPSRLTVRWSGWHSVMYQPVNQFSG